MKDDSWLNPDYRYIPDGGTIGEYSVRWLVTAAAISVKKTDDIVVFIRGDGASNRAPTHEVTLLDIYQCAENVKCKSKEKQAGTLPMPLDTGSEQAQIIERNYYLSSWHCLSFLERGRIPESWQEFMPLSIGQLDNQTAQLLPFKIHPSRIS